jgi:hypothetical protein
MPIDPKININENQVIFKRDVGHKHDGLTSSLIDYTKYSLFDFLPSVRASGGARLNFQVANERSLKTFIVDAVEERVLNPQGIRIQANTITANEIAVGTITANELVRDFIMVNNTMKSNNYVAGSAGWKISNTGEAEFNNVIVRGNVQANVGLIGGWQLSSNSIFKAVIIEGNPYSSTINSENSTIALYGLNTPVGTEDEGYAETTVAPGRISVTSTFEGDVTGFITADGGSVRANTISQWSDYRLKENFEKIENCNVLIKKLNPVVYNFKNQEDEKHIGFIAHEIQSIIPSIVYGQKDDVDEDGNPIYQSVDYSKLTPVLVGAVQDLYSKIEELESRLQTLEGV